ncbi:MAG TPA: amino acid adenylation domain-containing protein, partial [Longimicrobiaceae bacterium]
PEPRDLAGAPASAEPRTPEEEVLAGIWAGVLGAERVGVHQAFFELGGHSLLATQVVARVRRAFGVELPVRAVFEEPTVAGLAARVVRARREAEGTEVPPLRPVTREQAVPLSFAQERLWVVDQIEPGTAVYNIPAVLRLSGALDTAALERSLAEIVRRHEALRTVFASVGGRPVQVVVPASSVELPVEDVSADPGRVRLRAEEEARRPFDLAAGPLFRARLLRVADGEHALLLCMHHVVSDGWSLGVLFHEMSALYGAFAAGRESPLPELPVQYADYAVWQREWLTGETLDRQLAFWRERLAGAPAELELPTDRPRPAVQSHRGGAHPFTVPADVTRGLKALARAEGATLFMTLLAAWQTLLARYAGQDDVVVGTPVAGRTQPETEGLIGFFVNTLALRTDLSGAPSLRALLGRVREATLEAYAHQDLPFERLVDALGVARELGRDPVFQVVLVLQNAPGGAVELPGLELRLEGAETGTAKFDLTLAMGESGDGLEAALEYATELFDAATVERMAARFGVLLAAAAADPDRSVADLPLLDGAERAQLEAWSTVEASPAPRRCVHELFAGQARRTPDRVALVYQDERLTYAGLDRRADRLAHRLIRLGVGPDVRAGIFAERSPEMVVGMLAVLKAGGAYVPVDPAYPAERVAYMLRDAGVRVVLTQERLLDRLPDHPAETVLLDAPDGDTPAEGPPATGVTPDHLAYLIYTSGSTGLPKGTEVPHAAVPGFFRDVEYARFGGERVFLQHVSPSWDVLALELWAPLLTGGTCVLYPGQTSEPDVLGEQVRRHGVDTLWLSTAYFNLVVDSCPEILEGVEQVLLGGEAASVPHVRRALRMYPEKRFANCYGPTECTVFATAHVFAPDFDAAVVPIGKPIGDRRVHLLDRRFEAVPPGVPGELFIGGPSVARGYAGRAELTAEKFVPDPFSAEPGARLYRTGDRVRWTVAGELEFLGRVDFQVKVRGFRVEPG